MDPLKVTGDKFPEEGGLSGTTGDPLTATARIAMKTAKSAAKDIILWAGEGKEL